jgi:endonuclease/exonuclease/phosphatase family metal-dependent hydrolase
LHARQGFGTRLIVSAVLAGLGALAVAASGAQMSSSPDGSHAPATYATRREPSPAGRIVVVTANVQEAFGADDLKSMSELGVLVPRMLKQVPFRPDVVLLQDARKKAVDRIAQLLEKKTGDRYRVGQRLRREPWEKRPHKVWYSTETAILVNSATMKLEAGDFVRIYNPWGNPKKSYKEYKGQAYASATERDGDAEVGLMSVHLPKAPKNNAKTRKKYGPWVERLAAFMDRKYDGVTKVIGGDFNQTRCRSKDPCKVTPFWSSLSSADPGYTEALWHVQEQKHWSKRLPLGVDWIFTTDGIENADGDVKNPPKFYSNHRFFWGDLEVAP